MTIAVQHYAVLYAARTLSGDPMATIASEHRSLTEALAAAKRLLAFRPHVWVERWTDQTTDKGNRTMIRRLTGRAPEELVVAFHRRPSAVA